MLVLFVNCDQVSTSPHKMMYGHYLGKKNQHMSVQCVAPTILERDHKEFFNELERRWDLLETKRGLKFEKVEVGAKRKMALDNQEECEQVNTEVASSSSVKERTAIGWSLLPPAEKDRLREECQVSWDKAFAVCGIPFAVADYAPFRDAIAKTRSTLDFKLCCTKTMRTSRLDKLHTSSNKYKDMRMRAGCKYGFVITSDGWRSCAKRNYHNYLLVSVEGPIYLHLEEVTGAGGSGDDVAAGFEKCFNGLDPEVFKSILLGVTDTPSANRKAWRLLEAHHPKQIWVGCGAHEVSLLLKDWVKSVPEILMMHKEGLRVVKWINNHSEILKLYRTIVPSHFEDKSKHCIGLYMPGARKKIAPRSRVSSSPTPRSFSLGSNCHSHLCCI